MHSKDVFSTEIPYLPYFMKQRCLSVVFTVRVNHVDNSREDLCDLGTLVIHF
jgi:hypothetical protein